MAKTQTSCPRCRQPVIADVEQIFDSYTDPTAKQKLLGNVVNIIHCPSCGFQGMLATPIVYHDPEKELLLTYFPPEMNIPVTDQEKQMGPLINRVLNSLPNEKKKAYLFQPQSMLTYQTLLEKILEKDGITKEMIEDQQKRLNLLQRILTSPKPDQLTLIKQEEALLDVSFFSLLTRFVQSAMEQKDEKTGKELIEIQDLLFQNTKVGKELYVQAKETETAIKSLQDAGKDGLTREKLLEIVINAPNDTQLSILTGLARSGMDYSFFQMLSEKIDAAKEPEKQKLLTLREKLLKLTQEIDKKIQAEYEQAKQLIEKILSTDNIAHNAESNLSKVDELFLQVLENELAVARKNANIDRISKLEQIMIVIEKANEPPAEIKLIQELLSTPDDAELQNKLNEHSSVITSEFADLINNVIMQSEGKNQDVKLTEKLKSVYRAVLRFSMKKNLQ
jgi:NTP pyrophosphatase (non-canonical NTP hydrolase)